MHQLSTLHLRGHPRRRKTRFRRQPLAGRTLTSGPIVKFQFRLFLYILLTQALLGAPPLLVRELQILIWGGDPASCSFPELWRKVA
jgi:hypothetical protein